MGAENQCLHCHESQRCILPHREDTNTQPYNYRDYLHSQYSSRHTPSVAALPLITPHKVGEIKIPDLPFSRTSDPLIYVSQQWLLSKDRHTLKSLTFHQWFDIPMSAWHIFYSMSMYVIPLKLWHTFKTVTYPQKYDTYPHWYDITSGS